MSSSASLGRWLAPPIVAAEAAGCGSLNTHSRNFLSDTQKASSKLTLKENVACRACPPVKTTFCRYGSLASRKWRLQSTDIRQPVLEGTEETWGECKQLVSSLNFTTEEAEVMLGKAFGWVHSPYWGEQRKKETPKDEGVSKTLDYLRNLGLSDDDLHKLLKKFPEVLGCSLDDEVKTNVGVLERDWGIKGKTLRSLLLRNPKVLGYNVDCKGDCIAQCTRCWARF